MEHDENQNLDIREKLLRLPKIQADDNFLKRLQIQIDLIESEEKTRDVVDKGSVSGYFKNLFGARLVPALGISSVVVAAFLVYFILAENKESVVSDMTGNKNQQTVITEEKPSVNTTPEVTKTEEPKTNAPAIQNLADNRNTQEAPSEKNNKVQTETVTSNIRKNIANNSDDVSVENIQQPVAPVKTIETEQPTKTAEPPKNGLSNPNMKGSIRSEAKDMKDGTQDNSLKQDDKKYDNNKKSSDGIVNEERSTSTSEKTINEGGRGITEKSQKNTKPKKKEVHTINEINKNGLEILKR